MVSLVRLSIFAIAGCVATLPLAGCDLGGESDPASVGAAGVDGKSARSATKHYRSRPDLQPGGVRVLHRARRTAAGYIFYAPKNGRGQEGPVIVDNAGGLVWSRPLYDMTAADFKVEHYQGKPVLTWWQGKPVKGWGRGEIAIFDDSYKPITTIRAKGKWELDHHDHLITDDGTILIFVYVPVHRDASSLGGSSKATVMDGTIQEIDIKTGRKLFEWRSLDHIGLRDSYKPPPKSGKEPWDYFHINSVQVLNDGNLLVGSRNMHAVYKINRKTGKVMWGLGGKRSSFKMGRGTRFSWQHDARFHGANSLTIFDNAAAPQTRPQSRGIRLKVNLKRRRVTLQRQYTHPRKLLAKSQANMQMLPNGNVFIGWGAAPYMSEYSRNGRLLFDMRHLGGTNSYRAYRFAWNGHPHDRPAVKVVGSSVYASWNGATDVSRWRVLAGPSPDALTAVGEGRRRGFETRLRPDTSQPYIAVEALNASGKVLGTSKTVKR